MINRKSVQFEMADQAAKHGAESDRSQNHRKATIIKSLMQHVAQTGDHHLSQSQPEQVADARL